MCRAFNLTVSTRESISEEAINYVANWIRKKRTKYYLVVVESETSKLHLHAALYFEDNQDPRSMRDTVWKGIKRWHPTSIGKHAVQFKASPGNLWVSEYLKKEKEAREVACVMPVFDNGEVDYEALEEYYPDDDIQHALQKKSNEKKGDVFMDNLEHQYKSYLAENSFVSSSETAHEFLKYSMNEKRECRVIQDRRRVFQLALNLHEYATETRKLTPFERSLHERENGTLCRCAFERDGGKCENCRLKELV